MFTQFQLDTPRPPAAPLICNQIINFSPSKATPFRTPKNAKKRPYNDENQAPWPTPTTTKPLKKSRATRRFGDSQNPCQTPVSVRSGAQSTSGSYPVPSFVDATPSPLQTTSDFHRPFSPLTPTPLGLSGFGPAIPLSFSEGPPRHLSCTPLSRSEGASHRLSVNQKNDLILEAIAAANSTPSEFLYNFFNDGPGRSQSQAQSASRFLQGRSKYTPADILRLWLSSRDGRVVKGSEEEDLMYSLDVAFDEIKAVRPAITSFAAQIIQGKLEKEAKNGVKPTSGLHATSKRKSTHHIEWVDIGATTVQKVEGILQEHLPLAWRYLNTIAGNEGSSVNNSEHLRRPANVARLLPLAFGFLAFAFSTAADFMTICSRIGMMPAYSTISKSLKLVAGHEAEITRAHGRDPTKLGCVVFDNVQNYLRVRDHRVGSVNRLTIGLAATYFEIEGVPPTALDFDDKQARIAASQRSTVTVEKLLSFVDHGHLRTVFVLHWLRLLVNYIPELSKWKGHVSMLFATRAAKLRLLAEPTKIHCLSSSGKTETTTTELKEAMEDFFAQTGQEASNYTKQIKFVSGDGLSFQRLLEVQQYLQFHPDPMESLALVEPVLAPWHMEWADVCRIYETHYGSLTSPDPSSLGHSAAQVGHMKAPNLKKVDYYPGVDLMYLVLDVRMLDCWRVHFKCEDIFGYFRERAATNQLPDIEALEMTARQLHDAYSSTHGIYSALGDVNCESAWSNFVPLGSAWETATPNPTSQKSAVSSSLPKPSKRHPNGDRVLANSITFIRDALFSYELSYAIAEGDVGRVYEIMKMLLFTFAGSSHSKYSTYVLEMICRLELESSPELHEAVLRTLLVNLSGRPGSFTTADLMQEYFNRLLEAIVEKKGVNYGDDFIRNTISQNLHHFACIKLSLREGAGLSRRSGRHSAPHLKPEVKRLVQAYREHELHSRRPGRVYEDTDKDNFDLGLRKLDNGRLAQWSANTTNTRQLLNMQAPPFSTSVNLDSTPDMEEADADEPEEDHGRFGFAGVVDGALLFDTYTTDTLLDDFDDIIATYSANTTPSSLPVD